MALEEWASLRCFALRGYLPQEKILPCGKNDVFLQAEK
jgi:hypothetical protein